MKRDWLFDPAEAHQFSPYRPVRFAFHSDYSVSPLNNKISRLYHLVTPLPRCLRFTANITVYSTRLAIGGWLNLSEQDSHLLAYPPFVWAHNQNLTINNHLCISLQYISAHTIIIRKNSNIYKPPQMCSLIMHKGNKRSPIIPAKTFPIINFL